MIVDPKSHVPVYRQIVEQICRAIDAGVYRPGEAIPSQRTLAVELRVNPNTVQRAFDELLRDGVIESRRGRGAFVVDRRRSAPRGAAEETCESALAIAIDSSLDAGMTPSRIRELFETALRTRLSSMRSEA
jgi:GntR family transcriptional regulator